LSESAYIEKMPSSQIARGRNRSLITRMDFELTERCNNNCRHCYINLPEDDSRSKSRELEASDIRSLFEEIIALGCRHVRFTGGEPLLRDDFEQIYLYAKKLGLSIELFTNGTRITPKIAHLFKEYPPGEKIQISLYGYDQKSYEATSRTPGSFEAAQQGIALLHKNRIPFEIRGVILPMKKENFIKFEAWAKKINKPAIHQSKVTMLYSRCRGYDAMHEKIIKKLRLPPEEQLKLEASQPEVYKLDVSNFCSHFCQIHGDQLFHCGAGMYQGCVDAYGNLQMCLLLRHPDTVYNLRKGSLSQAFNVFFKDVRQMRAKNPIYLEQCARCFLRALCDQCPAVAWMECRSLDGWIEHICSYTHVQAAFIGLLEKNEKAWLVTNWEKRLEKLPKLCLSSAEKSREQ